MISSLGTIAVFLAGANLAKQKGQLMKVYSVLWNKKFTIWELTYLYSLMETLHHLFDIRT